MQNTKSMKTGKRRNGNKLVLDALGMNGPQTITELAAATKLTKSSVRDVLERLAHEGRSHKTKENRLYEALPLAEQRVIQAEYTRRNEYGDLPAHLRQDKACRVIGIALPYYKVALGSFKQQVWRMFE